MAEEVDNSNGVRVRYEEPAAVFARSRASELIIGIAATVGGAIITAFIPWFASGEPLNVLAIMILLGVAFWIALASRWHRILRRQRYRIGDNWIEPAGRPVYRTLQFRNYTIRRVEISEAWMRPRPYRSPSVWVRLTQGEAVDITPPLAAADGFESVRAFLRENGVGVSTKPPAKEHSTLSALSSRGKASIAVLVTAWAILSLIPASFAFMGRLPSAYVALFVLLGGAIVIMWTVTIRLTNRYHREP